MLVNNPLVYNPMLSMEQRLHQLTPLETTQPLRYNPMLSDSQRSILNPINPIFTDYAPIRQPLPDLNKYRVEPDLPKVRYDYIKTNTMINFDTIHTQKIRKWNYSLGRYEE